MRNLGIVLAFAALLAGCSRKESLEIPATGTDVTVQKRDGVTVAGRLVEVQAEQVVLESRDGVKTQVPRSEIASVRATAVAVDKPLKPEQAVQAVPTTGTPAPPPAAALAPAAPAAPADPENQKTRERTPEYREVTLP